MDKPLKNNKKTNAEEADDIGFSSRYSSRTQRLINRDGTFNVDKVGLKFLESFNIYHWLITISWLKFFSLIFVSFICVNMFFATLYYINGTENLGFLDNPTGIKAFMESFFFSTQTLTTVGYGRISPVNINANIIASVESLLGLLSFAIATGLLYGRFSKPFAKVTYSKFALIAPFKDKTSFMFRTANKHKSHLIDVEVQVVFSRLETINGIESRKFYYLKLEYSKINFFPSIWTVNHPIDETSPLYGMTESDLNKSEAEFLILLKGFDDAFFQTVHSRFSYRHDEIIWNAKFNNVHILSDDGKFTIALDRMSDYEKLN